ncbi:MAG TPA: fluoride efflux transporter CrcB [Ignavibacteria bacterium]|nr:fluoride efflux transporter CrcB [Ignavibacteria bacterium]
MQILLIGIGGFLGAISRFLVQKFVNNYMATFPMGTLVVNVLGSFILGMLLYGITYDRELTINLRDLAAIGFLGSFTTMSAFSHETMMLFDTGHIFQAMLNVVLNIVLCLFAVYAGRQIGLIVSGS